MLDSNGKYVMNDEEAKLYDALTSDKYIQSNGALKNDFGNCCLGVYCDMVDPTIWKRLTATTQSWNNATMFLPSRLTQAINWSSSDGRLNFNDRNDAGFNTLARCNDSGFTFSQIADIIKAGRVLHIGEEIEHHGQA